MKGLNGDNKVEYRFGYYANDDVKNPLSRHEVSHGPGHVTGSYAYIDANKQLQVLVD